jgi:DUF2075 family protein
MNSIKEVTEKNLNGIYYGNRLLLPFKANYIKVILEDEIITDFSPQGGKIHIDESGNYTDMYFLGRKDLKSVISKYESIKMMITEKDADIFNPENHLKISIYLEDSNILRIEKTSSDVLFIE